MLSLFDECNHFLFERASMIDFMDLMFAFEIESDIDVSGAASMHSNHLKTDTVQEIPQRPNVSRPTRSRAAKPQSQIDQRRRHYD
jgi:hypothetical protein